MAQDAAVGSDGRRAARFARAKFRPPALPGTLVGRPQLYEQLAAGALRRLSLVVGSAGAGKSVLLAGWAAARPPGSTAWLSCDESDSNPVRFWTGFIEAVRTVEAGFGADAADLLSMDGAVSADVIASLVNDVPALPDGSAIVVDDFHTASPAVGEAMTDLVQDWPAGHAQLVLASRFDPALRLHRLRISGELCELRDHDLRFSPDDSRSLLSNFGVGVEPADLDLLLARSEGWAAALQMAALSLRGGGDAGQAARALGAGGHAVADYFVSEVLDRQPPEVARFMLDTSVLDELTTDACAAVTGRQDSGALLRRVRAGSLFLVELDDERTSFRYHHLARQLLRAELRARDAAREPVLHARAAQWFEAAGDSRLAARHFLAAGELDRALALLQERVLADFLADPALPAPLDLDGVDPALLAGHPGRLLAIVAHLLLSGDIAQAGEYLDLLGQAARQAPMEPRLAARLSALRALRCVMTGQFERAMDEALTARSTLSQAGLDDEWVGSLPLVSLHVCAGQGDDEGAEREAAEVLALPGLPEPVREVTVPGALALARCEAGHLASAAQAARTAGSSARRLGFDQHYFALDYLRALAGLALEQLDLDAAEQHIEQALSICERGRPAYEYVTLLDRAALWAARGQVREALATVEDARRVLPEAGPLARTRADEAEALLRLALGDLRSPVELATGLPGPRDALLLARTALAARDHQAVRRHLEPLGPLGPLGPGGPGDLTPRQAVVRQALLAGAAIESGDPATAELLARVLETARRGGFLASVVTPAPQLAGYLVEQGPRMRPDAFTERLIAAALEVRATQPGRFAAPPVSAQPLTAAELRVLRLLPVSTYPQIAAALHVSRNTVKTQLRAIYQKLGVASRSAAIERALDLRLL